MSCQNSASASLLDHIATRGFQKGLGSDVTVSAFGHEYHLHRLILMQSKFFESLFVGQWREQGSRKVAIRFDDPCISRQCFEVVLACLYGITITEEDGHSDGNESGGGSRECKPEEEGRASPSSGVSTNDNTSYASPCTSMPQWTAVASEASAAVMASQRRSTPGTSTDNGCNSRLSMANVLEVLACASYLQVQSLCAQCTRYAIRIGVTMQYVVTLARFCQRHSYYPWTDNIQAACETYLCRNLWDNPMVECCRVLERLPASCLRRVLASDALWIPSEWERYKLCRQVVFRRRALWAARNCHRCCIYETGCQPVHQQRCTENTALEPELPTDNIDGRCSKTDVGAGATVVSIQYDDTEDGQNEDRLGMDSNGKDEVEEDMASESDVCDEEEEAVYHEIFARGIHYMYLSFEQLQRIRRDIDPWTGEPFTPGRVVHEALWHQIELRARIDASKSQDSSELGILIPPPSVTQTCQPSSSVADEYKPTTKATALEPSVEEKAEDGSVNEMLTSLSRSSGSRYAPFRFSVEFGSLHKLGSKARMYSKLVFYAG
ncbi:hypothetical protein BGW42_000851 [Actinomortierella wolfii]|nr:hypothetical protein BGW42_000851 [Actinomortierella wolfii]